MANEKSKTLIKERRRTEHEDRRPTEKALAAIRRMGPVAAHKMCSGLAHQINADLSNRQLQGFVRSEVEELQTCLERAAAVLKRS
jgi:C4-dicarboxylate-specific signal transduction histidine kinase